MRSLQSTTRLEDHVAALASFGNAPDVADDALAAATRIRIRESLARGHAWQRHAGVLVAFAIVFVASGAWALATGRLHRWLAPRPAPAMMPVPSIAPQPAATIAPPARPSHVQEAAPVVVPDAPAVKPAPPLVMPAVPAAHVVHATATPAAPAPVETPAGSPPNVAPSSEPIAAPPTAADALYTRAHELHFHGAAPADALAAWDAYLAAAPHGTFEVEARYNRALCLVRLGRLTEARAALEPYARGEVLPSRYRQPDAAHLIERIDHRVTKAVNGAP